MVCDLCGKKLKEIYSFTIESVERSSLCKDCYEKIVAEPVLEPESIEPIEEMLDRVPNELLCPPATSVSTEHNAIIQNNPTFGPLPKSELNPEVELLENSLQKNDAFLKVIWFLVCISITAIVSFYTAFPTVKTLVFGGQESAWGFEYLFCMFAPVPGVIGFLIAWFLLINKCKGYERGIVSAIIGVAVACIVIVSFYQIIRYPQAKKSHDESKFLQDAIQGKHDEAKIRDYYKSHPAPQLASLDRANLKISPKALELLIEVLDKSPSDKGILAALPEVSTEIKSRVAESPDVQAVLQMAIGNTTPAEVLIKLASHESMEISRAVNNNSNAPLAARYIYYIRAIVDEKERHVDTKKLEPTGLDDSVGKYVWESLSSDKREYVRLWIAKSLAPPQILKSMDNDPSMEVLKWVFLNNQTPSESIKKIATQFKTNQNELMERFCRDPDKLVRGAVAESPYTSDKILIKLMQDKDDTVSGWADSSLQQRGYEFDHSKVPPLLVKKPQRAL